jgi:hypothetical protein
MTTRLDEWDGQRPKPGGNVSLHVTDAGRAPGVGERERGRTPACDVQAASRPVRESIAASLSRTLAQSQRACCVNFGFVS